MQRQSLRIATLFDKPRSSSRSPLTPIPVPNEDAAAASTSRLASGRAKSIREAAAALNQRHHRMAASPSVSTSTARRRSLKFWKSKSIESGEGEGETEPQPVAFKWVRGEMLGKRTNLFLGLNATTGEMLVAKQYTFDATETPGRPSARSLKREVALMQRVDHANLVQCFGFEETTGGDIMVLMEYFSGTSLRAEIHKHGRLAEGVVQAITSQVLDALVHLHARGMVHGDLKSTKILVDSSGVCKIAGLGCSTWTDGVGLRDNSRAVPRAIWWTAPEIIRTQYQAWGTKADVWSVGCLVLEMLTGMRPWFDSEAVAVMFKLYHQTLRPGVPPDVVLSPMALDFLERCLALQPEDRMSAVELGRHPFIAQSTTAPFSGFGP
ncbi:kinase-like protein [Mycena amicta]|nr:kinase-like protein [Mycena amicta]